VRQLEVKFKRKDGSPYDALLSLRPVTIQDTPHLQAVVEDVTERNKVVSELVRLERLRALGEMPAGVSHNLNNMLSVVLGYASLLQAENKDLSIASSIDEIVASTVRASDLVKRLHHAVRSEGEQPQEPVDLNEIVRDTVNTTRPRWQDETGLSGVTVEVLLELEEIPHVRGTISGLNGILTNLLLNAVDAMPDGGKITIGTQPDDNGSVQLTVRDTGIGMDESTRRRLFEPCYDQDGCRHRTGLIDNLWHGDLLGGQRSMCRARPGRVPHSRLHCPPGMDRFHSQRSSNPLVPPLLGGATY